MHQFGEFHGFVEAFALLEDSYRKGSGDELSVDLERWAVFAESLEGGLTFLGDNEWGLFVFDEIEKFADVLGSVSVDIFDVNIVNQRRS